MKRRQSVFLLFFAVLLTGRPFADNDSKPLDLPSDQRVLTFLTQSVDWYQRLMTQQQIETEPADLLFIYNTRQIAHQIVQLSFDFARGNDSFATASGRQRQTSIGNTSSSDGVQFIRMQKKAEDAISQAAQSIEALDTKLLKARGAKRERVQAELDDLRSRMQLLQAESASLEEIIEFTRTSAGISPSGNWETIIDELARTVPEIGTAPPPTLNSDTSSGPKRGPGILGVASQVSALRTKLRNVDEDTQLTDDLAQSSENLHALLIAFINPIVETGDLSDLQTSDLGVLQKQKTRFDDLTVQLKALSPAVLALDKQKVLLTAYKSDLRRWRAAVVSQYERAWKELVLRLIVVAVIIASLLFVGVILRRVANRVHDANRRSILLLSQRLLIWGAIALVGIFAFAADFNSMATFFGLLTAGTAVALQSIIVASLGYFVLIGKRGIKIGDRVQISGIVGDVQEIGLLQFQIREFDMKTQQLTDNVITFSNSFVFVSPATGLSRLKP